MQNIAAARQIQAFFFPQFLPADRTAGARSGKFPFAHRLDGQAISAHN